MLRTTHHVLTVKASLSVRASSSFMMAKYTLMRVHSLHSAQ